MNKSQLKTYAPRARRDFIQMVRQRADVLGLTKAEIAKPEVQGDVAIIEGRPYPRRYADLHARLARKIELEGLDRFLDRVAYSWFNRFAALRYMEVNGYLSHPFRVLSNRDTAKSEPEILEHAAEVSLEGIDKQKVIELKLAGSKDSELYKLLLVAQCNELNAAMPFLFERINDESELLLPDNLLHSDSVIRKMVSEIDEENWKEVEIVGWLYQFYISEKKDEVIGKTVKSEDIPAATQLFTPNWIVKYMVQNSLGRLWLEANPDSNLKTQVPMEFYIEPVSEPGAVATGFRETPGGTTPSAEAAATPPKTGGESRTPVATAPGSDMNPESITILDPACGSGHILVEAYDLLKAIYTERGYSSRDIPELVLKNNLFGLDIDERAAQLSSFALLMKARADDHRLFDKGRGHLVPNVLAVPGTSQMEHDPRSVAEMFFTKDTASHPAVPIRDANLLFDEMQVQRSLMMSAAPAAAAGSGVTEQNVIDLLSLFEQGKTLGSLIRIPDGFGAVVDKLEKAVEAKRRDGNFYEQVAARELEPFVRAGKMLAQQYDCVIANPPYMGSGYFNPDLKRLLGKTYNVKRTDLYSIFIQRNLEMCKYLSMITRQGWMTNKSYESLREELLTNRTILNLVQLGANSFEYISGEVVRTCCFTILTKHIPDYVQTYLDCNLGGEDEKERCLKEQRARYDIEGEEFLPVPGKSVIFWVNNKVRAAFSSEPISQIAELREGIHTGHNETFLRSWWEISQDTFSLAETSYSSIDASEKTKWIPYNKGGSSRSWYGANEFVIAFDANSREQMSKIKGHVRPSQSLYFIRGGTWSDVGTKGFGVRYYPNGYLFDGAGPVVVGNDLEFIIALMNSAPFKHLAQILMPDLHYKCGTVKQIPFVETSNDLLAKEIGLSAINQSKDDWDSVETSWDFSTFPILDLRFAIDKTDSVEECWNRWKELTDQRICRMQELETENNRLFIDAYGLQDELSPEVPLDQITLARADKEKDTRRLLSYFIGCLMGRYSLDEPGLIYADAGNVGFDPARYKTFHADEDGIVPVTDMEWFPQEAARQFEKFIGKAFATENTEKEFNRDDSVPSVAKNLKWVAQQLGAKAGEEPIETVRRYFSTSFFKDHTQTYKKRPIYWLFSSGKQKAFECLVYLHRYNESTLPRMRHEYVLPLMSKLEAQIETLAGHADEYGTRSGGLIDTSASTSERNKLTKQLETLKKKQVELAAFDENLRHYSDMRISLDLDDGVKVNYAKFGDLLAEVKAITGTKGE